MRIEKTDPMLLGKRVRVYLTEDGLYISPRLSNKTADIDVIGLVYGGRGILLGSKTKRTFSMGDRNGTNLSPEITYYIKQGDYKYSRQLELPAEIQGVLGEAEQMDHTCKKCGYYNEFASPNQSDGSYLCRQCSTFLHIFGGKP